MLLAQKESIQKIDFILKKSKFWERYQNIELNERQLKAINKLFKAGPEGFEHGVNAKKYMGMVNCSKATATRDLSDLTLKGCLFRLEGGGRNIRYALNLENAGFTANFHNEVSQ